MVSAQVTSMTGLEVAGINLRIEDVLTEEEYERMELGSDFSHRIGDRRCNTVGRFRLIRMAHRHHTCQRDLIYDEPVDLGIYDRALQKEGC